MFCQMNTFSTLLKQYNIFFNYLRQEQNIDNEIKNIMKTICIQSFFNLK